MTTFHERLTRAQWHENQVAYWLTTCGWVCAPFGQGQLPPEIREHLKHIHTPVRWMADTLAVRSSRALFVDAKAGETHRWTGNHAIEKDALETAEKWAQFSQCDVVFIFEDGGLVTPGVVRANCWDGPYRGNGSGTPFVLFPTTVCIPFRIWHAAYSAMSAA
jgi:hypothetical protein